MLYPGDEVGPFEVLARLGAGAAGSVFRARLREDVPSLSLRSGDEVAVKVLFPSAPGAGPVRADALAEVEAGAGLSHPNLAAVHGAMEATLPRAGGQALLVVCELARGEPLAARLGRMRVLAEADLRRVAIHAARGLEALHARSRLHRDVKPANLVEAPDGTVRLVDFGLARHLETAAEEGLSGTLPYVAPERILDPSSADVRSDLYALGVTLFECATGAPPFEGSGALDLLRRHLHERPPRLRTAGARVTPGLEALVEALLEKDPDARPRDARVVLDVLEGRATLAPRPALAARAPPRARVATDALPLVGRAEAAARLREALDVLSPGRTISVTGERGAGKSRLVGEALAPGSGVFAHAGGEDPAALLTELLRSLSDGADGGIEGVLASVPALLAPARRLLEGKRPPRAAETALACLRAGLGGPVRGPAPVLVVDDAHALSASEGEALRSLLAEPGHAPWALVLCARADDATDAARALLDGANDRIALARLSVADLVALAAAAGAADGVRSLVAERLLAATGGNAGLATGLLLRMRASGALASGAESWNVLLDPASALHGSEEERLAGEREQGLDAETRRVLEAAAILGARFDPAVLARMLGEPPVRLLRHLADLEHRHRVLRSEGNVCRLDPELLASAVLAPLPVRRRRELHAAAASAFPEASPERVRHLALGGRAGEALARAAAAVAALLAVGRADAGLRLADDILLAAAAVDDPAPRFDLLLERLRCLRRVPGATGFEEALDVLERAAGGLDAGRRATALEERAGHLHRSAGDPAGAVRALRRAYALRRGTGDPRGRAVNLREQVRALAGIERLGERRRWLLGRVLRAARAMGDARLLLDTLPAAAQTERIRGRLAGALALLREAADVARRLADPAADGAVRTALALTLVFAGRHREALRANRAARAVVQESGLAEREAYLGRMRAESWIALGRPRVALRLVAWAAPVLHAFRNPLEAANLELARAAALVALGREGEALEVHEAVARQVVRLGDPRFRWVGPVAAAKAAARLGERVRAAAALRTTRVHAHGDPEARAAVQVALAIAAAHRGRFGRAARLARRASDTLVTRGSLWDETRYAHVLAAVLAVRAGMPAVRIAERAWKAAAPTDDPGLRALAAAALARARPRDVAAASRATALARRTQALSAFDRGLLASLEGAPQASPGALP